jgi:NAD+ diphosphatase
VPNQMKLFRYCPSCGSKDVFFDGIKKFRCSACSYAYYHNVAIGVGAILECGEKIVLIERGKEPGKGKLDLPGGFVEPKESAEEALRREIREEVGIGINAAMLKYFGSYPNAYEYKSVIYQTCDLFFYSRIDAHPTDFDRREVQAVSLVNPAEISPDRIAFLSVRACLSRFLEIRKRRDAE